MRGDTLLERLFGHIVQLDLMSRNARTRQLIQSLQADKEAYFREGHTKEKRRLELKILAKQADLAEQLVLEKEQSLPTMNLSLFGESAKDRRLREERERQEGTLQDLREQIHRVRTDLERKAKEKGALKGGDLDSSRRHYFQTGDAPTFLWRVDFAEVFAERKGFDIVIGNPPYLFGGNVGISQENKDAFKRMYASGSGKINLFTLFIEKSLSLLAEDRPLALIVPNTLLRVTSYDKIRELMITSSRLSMIVDLGAGMFDDVTMSTIVLVLRSGKPSGDHAIELRTSLQERGRLSNQSNYRLPGFVINSAASSDDMQVLKTLEQAPIRLGPLCEELIFGVVISGNRSELVSIEPKRGWKPFLEGRDIERYRIRPTDKYLNYKPSEIHRPRSPRIFEAGEKLLIQRITGGNRPLAVAYDSGQHYTKESINNLLIASTCPYSIKFLLGLLNSSLLSWYYRVSFTNGSTLTVNLSKEYLSQLPIPNLDLTSPAHKKAHDRLVQLVDEMLQASGRSTPKQHKLDQEIDEHVYRLYGLTEREIQTVERKP